MVLRGQKFLVLAFLLFIVLIAVPGAAPPGYLASPYHQAADMKMGAFFFNLTPIRPLPWLVLLLTANLPAGSVATSAPMAPGWPCWSIDGAAHSP